MLTKEAVLEMIRSKTLECQSLDGREFTRLADFMDVHEWPLLGVGPVACSDHDDCKADKALAKACAEKRIAASHQPKPWTREAVLAQMRCDVEFGFEKALDKRGLSAGAMHSVVCMWLTVLEDDDIDRDEYAQYGLPLFKAVALKYGFPNPIGNTRGDEHRFSTYGDDE